MAQAWRTVRVFISSTFRDMQAERDHLVTVVFPELRERVERLGLELYDVDLRWGVPQTGVDGERANSWAYCKRWIDRVEPFFVCILGQRYGWTPAAEEIPEGEDRAEYAGMSITEMEIRHAVLSGRHRKRSFFYFRQTSVPKDTPENIYNHFVDTADQARLEALKKQIKDESGRPVREYPCHWTGAGFDGLDAFGQVILEDLWSGVLRGERYVPKDAWRQALGHEPDSDPLYTDESLPIPQDIWEKIAEHAKPAPRDPLDAEAEQMAAFAESRLSWFQGRGKELEALAEFVNQDLRDDSSRMCVVRSVPGQGKSALLARFAENLGDTAHLVIIHFVGATERSADVRSLLERLVGELDRNGVPHPAEEDPKLDLESLRKRLAARLEGYEGERRIVLLIDAVNQLTGAHELAWLPHRLGAGVRIILSCIDDPSSPADSPAARAMSALRAQKPEPRWVNLSPLEEADVREIVKQYLDEYCKELDTAQIDAICRMEQARNPLYLLVMLHELRTLGGQDMHLKVPGIIARLPEERPDTVSLFDWVLERLESWDGREVFGREPVRLWCTYLALGRVGMSGRELSDLVARKLGDEAARTALRIERGIRRYLQRRGAQWDFFHGQLREAVTRRYMPEDAIPYHRDIGAYLETRWREPNPHALSELPHHQSHAQTWTALQGTLTNYDFVKAKVNAGFAFGLNQDFSAAFANVPTGVLEEHEQATLREWRDFVAVMTHRLVHMDEPFIQVAHNYADRGTVVAEAEARLPGFGQPWLRRTIRPPRRDSPAGLRVLEGHTGSVMAVKTIPGSNHALSTGEDNTLRLWNLDTGQCLQIMECRSKIGRALVIDREGRIAISGGWDGAIALFDLSSGTCVRTIEGPHGCVMALALTPDGRRLIAGHASRRVSLKIAEDQHESEHAKDEDTLRVWDLSSGACLSVLRGHTKTIMGLCVLPDGCHCVSASSDGTLRWWDLDRGTCVRSVRLDESIENEGAYAVVYMPEQRCLVSGGAFGTLQLWDAVDGRCLRKVFGAHQGSIMALAATPDGKRVVSGGRDWTVRVWSLETGECVKAFSGHVDSVWSVAVTLDGDYTLTASADHTVRMWNLRGDPRQDAFEGPIFTSGPVACVPPGPRLAFFHVDDSTQSTDACLRVWDPATDKQEEFASFRMIVNALAVSLDGRKAVWGGIDDTFHGVGDSLVLSVLQPGGPTCSLVRYQNHCVQPQSAPGDIAITPDGRFGLSGGGDGIIRVWDLGRLPGQELRESGDNTVRRQHSSIRVWDLPHSAELEGHTKEVTALALTPDGRLLASASNDSTVRVWDLEYHHCRHVLRPESGKVRSIAVTAEGRRVLSLTQDGTLRLWDIVSGQPVRALTGLGGPILNFVVTPEGQRVVSVGADRVLRLWHLATGRCHKVLGYGRGELLLTHDARHVLTWNGKSVHLWKTDGGGHIVSYRCMSRLMDVAPLPDGMRIVVVEHKDGIYALELMNVVTDIPVVTAVRLWLYGQAPSEGAHSKGHWDVGYTVSCPYCGRRFPVEKRQTSQQIVCAASRCRHVLRINRFVCDNEGLFD